ncbi:MAG: phosphopentomutase, partial [Lachnospiraceae bacterium]|nr:phosphopentomutase [Lachnospiraceae bacterium]
ILTADHGCDPGYLKTTDHTREYVPCIMYGKKLAPANLGTRSTFADIAASVLAYLGIENDGAGESML